MLIRSIQIFVIQLVVTISSNKVLGFEVVVVTKGQKKQPVVNGKSYRKRPLFFILSSKYVIAVIAHMTTEYKRKKTNT